MTTPNLPISQWSVLTVPSPNTSALLLNPGDTVTAPAGPGGSNQRIPLSALLGPVVWPSGDVTGVKDTANIIAAISSVPANGGVVTLIPTNQWYINSGQITVTRAGTYINAAGCLINALGSGDAFRMYDSVFNTPVNRGMGILGFPVIDGTATSGDSSALHIGDCIQGCAFIQAQNFSAGTQSKGLHLDNTAHWTEQFYGRVYTRNCTSHVVFDVNGGFPSYARTELSVYVDALANQDCMTVQNGAFIYDSAIGLRGNTAGSANPVTNAVLRITGQGAGGNAGTAFSVITTSRLDIGVEQTIPAAHTPQTIVFGSIPVNAILGCYGVIDFAGGGGAFSPTNFVHTNASTFIFSGPVTGDANLSGNAKGIYSFGVSGALQYSMCNLNPAGVWSPGSGDFFKLVLSQNITVTLTGQLIGGPQRKTIILSQPSGAGTFTVTWPHTATPTLAAPTVVWAGGTPPVMSTGAGATDMYELSTTDGLTWYGRATQGMS